jgi:hypothetical protein
VTNEPYFEVLDRYESFDDKGRSERGYRLTILTAIAQPRLGDVVRIWHVCESVSTVAPLYVMGPKPVWNEYVDDVLATEQLPPGEDPLAPSTYDGRVMDGPGIDTNYEITEYRFTSPGLHTVQWRLDPHLSNELRLAVE